jgi:hypothetical protein
MSTAILYVCLGIALLCLILALFASLVHSPHQRQPQRVSPAIQAEAGTPAPWQPLELRITLVGPPDSGKTVYTKLALEQALTLAFSPQGFALNARDNRHATRMLEEAERLRSLLRHQPNPPTRTLHTTHLNLAWATTVLAHFTWTDMPSHFLSVGADDADPDLQCLADWEDHLYQHTDVLVLVLPVTLLRVEWASQRRRWQALLHQVLLDWLRNSRTRHRSVVLSPSCVDELAASHPEARSMLQEGAMRQLYGKVMPLLESRTGLDLDEWWIAPISGFGFVPPPAWEFETVEPQPLLAAEPQPLQVLPLLQGLVHEAALRRHSTANSVRDRNRLLRLCAALRADIQAQDAWLFKSVEPARRQVAA